MNAIRQIQALNARENEAGVSTEASWHADYRDTAYIYIGGLPFDLSEGDIITIFSQYGEPTYVNLVRDKDTGKSKGFAFLKYEDQRSCDLAVDNLTGATVMGRVLRVDHTRYKQKDDEEEEARKKSMARIADGREPPSQAVETGAHDTESEEEPPRPLLKEERELAELLREQDDEDPMKAYLIKQKKEEVAEALKALAVRDKKSHKDKSRRREHRRDRSRDRDSKRRHRHRDRSETDSEEERRRRRRRDRSTSRERPRRRHSRERRSER